MGTAAACSNVSRAGFGTRKLCDVPRTYSAREPLREPKTSSPGRNCVTFLPTASTCPATSMPMALLLGFRSPATTRTSDGLPRIMCQSYALTAAARTRTRMLSSSMVGISTSLSSRTSGGPYLSRTIAFIVVW